MPRTRLSELDAFCRGVARAGLEPGTLRDCTGIHFPAVCGVCEIAAVLFPTSGCNAAVHVYAAAVDDSHSVARRRGVARDVLSAGRVAPGTGVAGSVRANKNYLRNDNLHKEVVT